MLDAAQYLRMSTEHQRYSLDNQRELVARYADANGFRIVRSFEDDGRSGLTLKGRPGLKALLAHALGSDRDFETVLVVDVSRWGRFQDPDQAAHYEFMCREAGVTIRYCAEQFGEADNLAGQILKSVKRIMAAEYSRVLSERVLAGQLRLAKMGFVQGGLPPFGVHRVLISESGEVIKRLHYGERKALATHRIAYIPGSDEEQKIVRLIFRLFATGGHSVFSIADTLEADGLVDEYGASFSPTRVSCMLRNRLYCGEYTFNRRRKRLAGSMEQNPTEAWVRMNIFPPIVSESLFQKAQSAKKRVRRARYTDDQLLGHLRAVFARNGCVTTYNISRSGGPAHHTYERRFGSLANACLLIGCVKETRPNARTRRKLTDAQIIERLQHLLAKYGYLSSSLLSSNPDSPSREVIIKRFGTLVAAYNAAGWRVTAQDLQQAAADRFWRGGRQRPLLRSTSSVLA